MSVLFTLPPSPGLPPVETRYTGGFVVGHVYFPVIENVPSFAVVTVLVSNGADAPRSAVIFAAYNWMVAPEMACCPPCTTPEICGKIDDVGAGDCRSPMEHPDKKMEAERKAKETTR